MRNGNIWRFGVGDKSFKTFSKMVKVKFITEMIIVYCFSFVKIQKLFKQYTYVLSSKLFITLSEVL